ncbi:TrkH family potassium uptake protein [Paenirhodobacter sp. CAU 1674]|uniref:TrkH family potassium uptake protein n=1 Tax=Paenirhodobacter sp. CAU 1674 TaxID=3032596 RepID=UPI0023DC6216|nr:TrkH family potassium uptake protein [Paenirhodobacter sp. CAU 1674]MDF2140775.1 TrkH family potassium uptake protein [Paenirhodobacter sp. CAU 1674]
MPDFGPVFHHLGLILLALGVAMLGPVALDFALADPNWAQVFEAAIETILFGALLALASASGQRKGLTLQQAYLLTAAIWIFVPFFGALPFIHGRPDVSFTDAYFEAVSGITTTGYTVFSGLEDLPKSVVLWRGMLNWMGGLGIAFVAMIFLPVMRIGGMRYFQTEGFDTLGKVLPRAGDIAISLLQVYAGLTVLCALVFTLCGMSILDAVIHAMAAIATGGFGTYDANFAVWSPAAQYAGTVFMLLGAMPYIRFFQLLHGQPVPLWRDLQVRAFLRWYGYFCAVMILYRLSRESLPVEQILRETTFNFASLLTGTGFGVSAVEPWGAFAMVMAFLVGMVGGCTGSSSGALSVFRVQATLAAIRAAVLQLHAPHRIVPPRYGGTALDETTLGPLMLHVSGYILTLGVLSVALSMTGVDFTSSLFAIWGCLGNIGFGVGPLVARTGTMIDFNDLATWLMTLAMLLGRLGLLAILVLVMPRFWRD